MADVIQWQIAVNLAIIVGMDNFLVIIIVMIAAGIGIAIGMRLSKPTNGKDIDSQLAQLEGRLKEKFQAAATEALHSNQKILISQTQLIMENAQKQSISELEKKGLELQKTLSPLQSTLQKLEGELKLIENSRLKDYSALGEQLKELSSTQKELHGETRNLVQALRAPQARGAWGELQLKRAVEFAGMTQYVDFNEQVTVSTANNDNLRPDMIIRLPNERCVVVDAKVPMKAYLDALEAKTPKDKLKFLADHARQLRDHFKKLGQKQYWGQFKNTPEFVVLFLHTESILSAALEQQPQLIEDAFGEKVIIATPTTLVALLKTVAYGWREAGAAEKAKEVVALGNELLSRFGVVAGNWQEVGRALNKAVDAYNQAANSTQSRLMVTARKMGELQTPDFNAISSRANE